MGMHCLCVCVCDIPGNVWNSLHNRLAERVPSNFQHAARDEQEEQEGAAQSHSHIHPYALPVENK